MTTTNVFVHHAQDREGRFTADLIHAFHREPCQSLPIESPDSLRRLRSFLEEHGWSSGMPLPLPLIVVMNDLGGTATHTHRIMHGEPLVNWLRSLITSAVQQHGAPAVNTLRELIATHLSMHTIQAMAIGLSSPTTTTADQVGGAAEPSPPPPPPPSRVAMPGRQISQKAMSMARVEDDNEEDDEEGTWSVMPARASRSKGTVNVMDVMKQGDMNRKDAQSSLRMTSAPVR